MGDPYTWTVSRLLFPLHERLKGHATVRLHDELERSQWWSPDRLETYRVQRLRAFLTRAGTDVPYYRRLFAESGFDPARVKDLADLRSLPMLAKADIRDNVEALKRRGATGLRSYNTGGSTGEPLIFYLDDERVSHDVAAKWRATRWWDVDIGDREIVVWGSAIEVGAQDWLRAARDRLLRTRLLPAFDLSEQVFRRWYQVLHSFRPRMIFGYPSVIAEFCTWADGTSSRLDDLGVRVVFVTAERLYEHQREQIAGAFGCRVANGYGGRDAGFLAHECPHGGMHVMAEDIVLETTDDEGQPVPAGEPGEIVVTHLATGAFPFVRYRTGDVGRLSSHRCGCGRALPLLDAIDGRSTDFIVTPEGRIVHALALIYVVRETTGVHAFKIIQEQADEVQVLLVTEPASTDIDARILEGLRRRLGEGMRVLLQHVERIPREPNGKFRYVVNRVTRPRQPRTRAGATGTRA